MSRYINELAVTKSPEESDEIIERYLSGEGFKLKTRRDGRSSGRRRGMGRRSAIREYDGHEQ